MQKKVKRRNSLNKKESIKEKERKISDVVLLGETCLREKEVKKRVCRIYRVVVDAEDWYQV